MVGKGEGRSNKAVIEVNGGMVAWALGCQNPGLCVKHNLITTKEKFMLVYVTAAS